MKIQFNKTNMYSRKRWKGNTERHLQSETSEVEEMVVRQSVGTHSARARARLRGTREGKGEGCADGEDQCWHRAWCDHRGDTKSVTASSELRCDTCAKVSVTLVTSEERVSYRAWSARLSLGTCPERPSWSGSVPSEMWRKRTSTVSSQSCSLVCPAHTSSHQHVRLSQHLKPTQSLVNWKLCPSQCYTCFPLSINNPHFIFHSQSHPSPGCLPL